MMGPLAKMCTWYGFFFFFFFIFFFHVGNILCVYTLNFGFYWPFRLTDYLDGLFRSWRISGHLDERYHGLFGLSGNIALHLGLSALFTCLWYFLNITDVSLIIEFEAHFIYFLLQAGRIIVHHSSPSARIVRSVIMSNVLLFFLWVVFIVGWLGVLLLA